MIKRSIVVIVLLVLAAGFWKLGRGLQSKESLSGVAHDYATREVQELGAMNLVTAIVVTYRGLDTLGEVSVLFLAATGVAVLLRRKHHLEENKPAQKRDASDLVKTGSKLLTPFLIMFGVYIFMNGHLSPGGGFQGGAVIASGILFLFLANVDYKLNHKVFEWIESLSGFSYVVVGVLGLILAGGFLDNRIVPLGEYGRILSAGAIPIIYTFIGLKVGTELAGILENLKGDLS